MDSQNIINMENSPRVSIPLVALDQPPKAISQSSPEQLSPRGTYFDKIVQTQYRYINFFSEIIIKDYIYIIFQRIEHTN